MSQLVDRRLSGKNRSAVNRQRFLRRFKGQIRKAVADAVSGRKIGDLERGEKISIPSKDLSEPVFHHGPGGRRNIIHPGNQEFVSGDKVDRPQGSGGGGGGGNASQDGEGMDDFVFELSKEEFMDFFFQDLALPDLVKKQLAAVPEVKRARAGFVSQGNPSNLHVVRSMKQAIGRRLAMAAGPREALKEAEEALEALIAEGKGASPEAEELREEIAGLKARIAAVPYIDTWDLRYANRVDQPTPSSQAVMFCLMDVSGSMDEDRKNIAKRFFMLLYLFLTKSYERIDVVFIRHHTVAMEVDEEDFFHSRESGGTVVSSALDLMREIVLERYPSQAWNIYAAQASDGDNWEDDSPRCREILSQSLLPLVQYFAYVEIEAEEPQSLWHEYERVAAASPRFAMQRILTLADIYPVFRELFRKKVT
ncbi:MAG TPA: YeaH/YhbH family protein [Thiobacillaceae bacterium]|nr:YeaH/YhbH family protein [Thiobacillaceae bacterium]HNA83585.1 YeaH/YhbH family protein [Thiobacillaceae bacterium]HNH90649.1 YeaH/YhbH family protein [Thiobacillaceae bacterium]